MDQYSSIQKIRDTSDIFGQVGVETTSDFRTGILLSDEAIQLLSISAQQYLIECFKEAHFFSVDEKFIMTVEDSYAKLKKKKINFVLEAMKVINFEWDHDSILDVEKERNCCGNDYGETNLDHVACLSSREYLRAVRLVQERDSQNIKSFEIPECGENNPYFLKKEFQLESLVNHHYKDFDPYAKVGDIVQMLNDEENPLVVTERVYDEHGTRTPYIFELKSLKDEIITQELEVEDEYILDECYYLKREGTWAFTS